MTPAQKLAYRFFLQTLVLLILYVLVALLGAVKYLSPNDPLVFALPYNQVGTLANILLNLTALTGLLGGGIYIASQQRPASVRLMVYTGWLWTALLVVAILGGLLGISSGRNGIELPSFLQIALVAALVSFAANIIVGSPRVPVVQIWGIGIGISAFAGVIALLNAGDYLQDRVFRSLALGLNLNVAYPLAAVALGFWLMRRFSNVPSLWADQGVYSVAGMVTVAGVLVSLPAFYVLGAPDWAKVLGNAALMVVPILDLIFAAHCYRALSDRNPTHTLAAHWFALSLVLFLLAIGFIGAIQAVPGVSQWTIGTRLSDLQSTLTLLAVVAVSLGFINQSTAELRGQNRRVTGLMPFWLVAFGILGSGIALGLAGVVQSFLERQLSVGYLDTQTLLIPLYTGWVIGLAVLTVGVVIYSLIFWLRRPAGK
jgi:nitric oxide reductase subunit B